MTQQSDHGPTEPPETTRRSPGAITAVLALSGIVVSLMQTLVIPIIPALPRLLHASASDTAWVVTATLLAAAVITPISGRLGDMFGKRRLLLASLLALLVGSLVCALSDSLAPMVIGRGLQGCATGAIPLGISILRDELPTERVGSAISLMSATLGVGGAVGLPISATVAQYGNWHLLFWLSAALGAVCALLVLMLLPESTVRTPGRFDLVGALGLTAVLLCLLLPITKGGDWGWSSGTTLGLFASSVVLLFLWALWELRVAQPLVDLRVSARRPVLFTNLASVLVGFSMFAMSLTFPQLLQSPEATGYGFGQSMLMAGLALAPGGLVMMLLSPVSSRISARWGPRVTLLIGLTVIGLGYALGLALMNAVWQIVISSMIIGGGVGIAYAAMPALIMGAVPPTETAAANGLNALMRSIGTSSSSAVMSVVLAQLTMRVGPATVPTQGAFQATFGIAIGAAAVGIALTLLVPQARTSKSTRRPADAPAPTHALD